MDDLHNGEVEVGVWKRTFNRKYHTLTGRGFIIGAAVNPLATRPGVITVILSGNASIVLEEQAARKLREELDECFALIDAQKEVKGGG